MKTPSHRHPPLHALLPSEQQACVGGGGVPRPPMPQPHCLWLADRWRCSAGPATEILAQPQPPLTASR